MHLKLFVIYFYAVFSFFCKNFSSLAAKALTIIKLMLHKYKQKMMNLKRKKIKSVAMAAATTSKLTLRMVLLQ